MIGLRRLEVGLEYQVGEEAGDVLQLLPFVLLLGGQQYSFEQLLSWGGLKKPSSRGGSHNSRSRIPSMASAATPPTLCCSRVDSIRSAMSSMTISQALAAAAPAAEPGSPATVPPISADTTLATLAPAMLKLFFSKLTAFPSFFILPPLAELTLAQFKLCRVSHDAL